MSNLIKSTGVYTPSRRTFLGAAAGAAVAAPALTAPARADGPFSDGFPFEFQRTEAEWREMLTEEEYRIMRDGGTEPRFSSDWWDEEREGTYSVKGSNLEVYTSEHKVPLLIGWVFFKHSFPDTVMTGIDTLPAEYGGSEMADEEVRTIMEVHCRMSGSHLGHIVSIDGQVLHCINGAALNFTPAAA